VEEDNLPLNFVRQRQIAGNVLDLPRLSST
jgi:hypothetical protein